MSKQRTFGGEVKAVGERQVRVVASTATLDRQGDIVVPEGIDLTQYMQNPVVLRQHDHDHPVARCSEIAVKNGRLEALVQFPPEGTSDMADETYKLVKSGVINAVSIGFMPGDWEPIDADKGYWGGRKYLSCELLEFSFVSVPANPDALVVERSLLTAEEQIALARKNLDAIRQQNSLTVTIDASELRVAIADAIAEAGEAEQVTKGEAAPNYRPAPMCKTCNHGKTGGCAEHPMPNGFVPTAVCDGWVEMKPDEIEPAVEDAAAVAARKRAVAARLKAAGLNF